MKAEYTPVDAASKVPLLFLLRSSVAWLVVGSLLGFCAYAQLHTPTFLSGHGYTSYGRMTALAETAFVYGWLANAGIALALWMLVRLSGEPLRGQNWALGGWIFWNVGVLAALVGVAHGDATGFALLELPRYVQLDLVFSYGALAVPGILAWSGRKRETAFASQWYAACALFCFPWLLSVAHVMLFAAPARGVLQAVVAAWYAQGVWSLWLAPLALSIAYFVVPKLTGKVLPSYEFALLGFWTLVFVGTLTAGRTLLGGPVPAWIPSLAVVSCALLLFQGVVVALNLRPIAGVKGVSARLITLGLLAYVLSMLASTVTSFHAVAVYTQFTYFDEAQRQLSLYGAISLILMGGIYYALPRISGRLWTSANLIRLHATCLVLGVILLLVGLVGASCVQSQGLSNASVSFATITANTRPWLELAFCAQGILLLGNIAFAVNLITAACCITDFAPQATFNPETSAS